MRHCNNIVIFVCADARVYRDRMRKVDLQFAANDPGSFYIEFFTGDSGDNNIFFFFPGAMSVLQPFLDDGTLVSPSGQTDIMQVATPGWSAERAQQRMEPYFA